MNEHILEVFLQVYKDRSISKAAAALFVTPQSVSRTIIEFENEVGEQLFKRNHRYMEPTPAAVKLKIHAENILTEYASIRKKGLDKKARQELKIYCTYGVVEYLGPSFVQELYKYRPDILLYLIEVPDKQAQELMLLRDQSIAVLSDPCDPSIYDIVKLFTAQYSYVLSKFNPLSSKESISVSDMNGATIIGKGSEFQQYINQMSSLPAGASLDVLAETTSYHLSMQIAKGSLACALVPTFLADTYAPPESVVRPAALGEMEKPFYLVRKKGVNLDERYEVFSRFLIEWVRKG